MNCKVCGTRLGILERWRYGDFCSQDHREIFALDLAELDKKLVADAAADAVQKNATIAASKTGGRKPEVKATLKAANSEELTLAEPVEPAAEGEAETEPPMAGFVPQGDATPCDPMKRKERERRPVVEKTEKPSEVWRAMARKAVKDELPPANPAALKGRELPSIVVEAPQQASVSSGGFCLDRSYAVMSPPAGTPIRVQGMPQPGLTMPAPGFWGPSMAVTSPFVPAQPSHWVDEQGWHWISDAAAMSTPTVESVLSMYPMAAPWANWPVMAPGAATRPMQAPAPMPGPMPGALAAPASGLATPGAMGGPMGMHPAAGPQSALGVPQPYSPAGVPGAQSVGQPRAMSAQGGPVQPGHSASMPSSMTPSMPPSMPAAGLGIGMPSGFGPASFGPPSLGGMGPGVAGGLFGGGQVVGWGVAQQPGSGPMPQGGAGYYWRELPPPFFSALVDLSFGVRPMDARRPFKTPSSRHEAWPAAAPQISPLHIPLPCEVAFAQQVSIESDPMNASLPQAAEPAAPPQWPGNPATMPSGPGLPRPRVPRRVAPAVVLPLGSRLGLPKPAEPLMLTGSGQHGGRAV